MIAVLLVWPSFRLAARLPEYVHLAVMWPTYMKQINADRQTRFDWGRGGFITFEFQNTLVYDPTDGINALNFEPKQFGGPNSVQVSHLIGHFYFVEEHS